ncbi:MAG: CrcB family protein [Puia sp.]
MHLRQNTPGSTKNGGLLLITGICGGYTTFSTFSYDGFYLLKSGSYFSFLVYVFGTLIVGMLATFAGVAIFK